MTASSYVPQNSRPPYLLGLLCLIPLVGAFVGFALILYGMIKYKDKWLTLIGIGGIVFTICIYSSLLFAWKHLPGGREADRELTKTQLNRLIHDIEFYNLQYGKYPDSLTALLDEDPFAPTSDPSSGMIHSTQFNYKKIENKYTVFSSGENKIAGDSDDIYPDIFFSDSSKIGLIKNR
jgi:hypothetical protein